MQWCFGRGKPLPYKLTIHKNPPSSQPSQNRTIPCFAPSHLPPLLKGGGLTARHKPWYYCFLLAICQPFLCCKLFAVKTEGLHNNSSPRITLSKTVLSLCPAPHSRLPWVKWAGLRQSYFYHKLSCSAIQVYLISSQPYLSQDWGIVTPPRTTLPKTALSLRPAPHSWLPWVKGAGLRQGYFYHKLSCSAIQVYLISSQPYLSQDWGIVTPSAPPFPKTHYPLAPHHHPCLLINALFVSHTHYHHCFL